MPVSSSSRSGQTKGRAQEFQRKRQPAGTSSKGKTVARGERVPGARKIVMQLLPGFSRQLAGMLSAGMPIVATLDTLEEQCDHPHFKMVLARVKAGIENGSSLSESMRGFPSVFSNLYTNMVSGGERGGKLPETITRLAMFLEASARLRQKVKSAMMYPTIVLCLALGIATAMILFVVPVFGNMFADFGAKLPAPTQALLNLSIFMRRFALIIFAVIGVSIFAFKKWKASPSGSYAWDSFTLKMPVFGDLNKKVASARFARTLGQLIRSGVPILSALEIAAGSTGNGVAEKVVMDAKDTVEKGDPLSSALLEQKVFPLMLVRMLQAGEKTGKVDEMMDNIAEFYEDEIETTLSGLTSLLEPLLMIFLGVIIGGIVLCLFLPIFKMGEIVGNI